jgi:hypothetical protein
MDDQRLSEWKALVESTEDPVDRSDLESQMLREWPAPYIPAEYDSQDLEMWHRVLSASIQSPPRVVEGPVRRNLIEPQWLREVYRGTREDTRRLLLPSRQDSQSASMPRFSAPARWDPTTLGSNDVAASSGWAEPLEAPEESQARLRTRR